MYANKTPKRPKPVKVYGAKQPRPALRKQGTRKGAVAVALREAGLR